MKKTGFLTLIVLGITLFSCQESGQEVVDANDSIETQNAYQPDQSAIETDKFIEQVENNFELREYSSLEYMKGEGDLYEVRAFKDSLDTNYQKLIEYTTSKISGALQSNIYYFKGGKKVATRKLAEEGTEADVHFVERITYYGQDGSPIVTKERVAVYEEQLASATFVVGKSEPLSEEKALRALDQEGEFAPLFEGFVEGEDLFMVVGENKPDGYTSALLVQTLNGAVGRIYKDPEAFKGKQLLLAFTKESSSDGDYQLLYGVTVVE